MKLLVDIGNTHIVTTLSENDELLYHFRVPSTLNLTEDLYSFYLESFLRLHNLSLTHIKRIILCSVVPALHKIILRFSQKYSIDLFDANLATNLSFELPYALAERGNDRVAVIEGVIGYYSHPSFIAIDFGTATTIEVVINQKYMGGNIIAGYFTTYNAITGKAALLDSFEIIHTDKVYGISLQEQLSCGILHGYIGQLTYLIDKVLEDFPNIPIIVTGGVAALLTPYLGNRWTEDKYLLEKGLLRLEKNSSRSL